jgi:signal transduction histidine kinase
MNKPASRRMDDFSTEEESLFGFLDDLPWPVIVIREDGQVIRVTGGLAGQEAVLENKECASFEALFPDYFSILRGCACWLVAQEAELTRQLPDGAVHERIVLRRVSTGSYLIVLDQTKLRTLELSSVQTSRLSALGFMVAGVCHEMGNPLTSIHSMVQILNSRNTMEPDLLNKGLTNIAASVKRLMNISSRLLNFGRVGEEPQYAFAVDASIEEAFAVIRRDRHAEHFDLEFERDPGAVIFGSSSQMQEVFINIFENAFQAMNGVGKLHVKTQRKAETSIIITVRDTGPGISNEAIQRLFDPFFTTKPAGHGTGLGLAISREILCEHDGLISAENNADAGACFCIELPLYKGKS